MDFNHVCVVGLGYIGLPTAAMLASKGLRVTGVDINPALVASINAGACPISEHDLAELISSTVSSKQLTASLTPCAADVFILVVPTPFKENHQPDLTFVEAATKAITPFLKPGNLIILESTSPVGTTDRIAALLRELRPDLNLPGCAFVSFEEQLYIAHCPERVLPGQIIFELVNNDRIIGGLDAASSLKAQKLYEIFCIGEMLISDARTAEMAKLTENAFRDVNIAFANELANICDTQKINVWELIKLANHHPRVNILQPGPGVGGHCIAVDPWFIIDSAPLDAKLIRSAREVNDGRPDKILAKIYQALAQLPNATIACLGLSYKANVGDLRESPAVAIVKKLASNVNNKILVVEPHIEVLPENLCALSQVQLTNFHEACRSADLIILLVGHKDFLGLNTWVHKEKLIIDSIGLLQPLASINGSMLIAKGLASHETM